MTDYRFSVPVRETVRSIDVTSITAPEKLHGPAYTLEFRLGVEGGKGEYRCAARIHAMAGLLAIAQASRQIVQDTLREMIELRASPWSAWEPIDRLTNEHARALRAVERQREDIADLNVKLAEYRRRLVELGEIEEGSQE